jgi:hypothetical protein
MRVNSMPACSTECQIAPDSFQPKTVGSVLKNLRRDPVRHLLLRWNWKSALLSSVFRALLFLFANLLAGWPSAVRAMSTELALRFATSGFYGAITEAFSAARPSWAATATVMVLLPCLNHSLEFIVHWMRGTPNLSASIGSSIIFTAFSTAFNLYAMQRGVLTVGGGSRSLQHDLCRVVPLFFGFLSAGPRLIARRLCREEGSI